MFKQNILQQVLIIAIAAITLMGCKKEKDPEPAELNCQIKQYEFTFPSYGGSKVSYLTYNNEGQITQIIDSTKFPSPIGQVTQIHTLTYNADGKLATFITKFDNSASEEVTTYTWTNDLLVKVESTNNWVYTLTYDADKQVTEMLYANNKGEFYERTIYTYESKNNWKEALTYKYVNGKEQLNRKHVAEEYDNKKPALAGLPFHQYTGLNIPTQNNPVKGFFWVDANDDGQLTDDEKFPENHNITYNESGYVLSTGVTSNVANIQLNITYDCE